jgi:hypothetical protein
MYPAKHTYSTKSLYYLSIYIIKDPVRFCASQFSFLLELYGSRWLAAMQKLPQFYFLHSAWRGVALRPLHFTLIVCRGHGGSQPVSPMQPSDVSRHNLGCRSASVFSLNSRRRRLRWTRGVTDRRCSGSRDSVGHGQGRGDPTARALTSADPHPGTRGASSPRSTSWDGLVELELKRRGRRRRLFDLLLRHFPRPARAETGGIFCLGKTRSGRTRGRNKWRQQLPAAGHPDAERGGLDQLCQAQRLITLCPTVLAVGRCSVYCSVRTMFLFSKYNGYYIFFLQNHSRPVWIVVIEFHSNKSNFSIYQLN